MDFRKFLFDNNLKSKDVASYLGITEASVSRYTHNTCKIPINKLQKLTDNPFGWDTSALTDESINVANKGNSNVTKVNYKSSIYGAASTTLSEQKDNTVPIIPLNAMAGTLNDYTDGVMPYQCERIVNPFASQATMAIRVNGDSMLPKYPNGTLVFCTKVNEKAFIEYFRTYVLDTANGVVIKQVEPSDNDDSITCVSINSKYPPFRLDKQYIYGWWKVVGCVQFE